MSENNFENKPSKSDNTLLWKTGIVLALSIFLLIPVSLTRNLVKERQETKSEAISEVKEKWGGEQVISGPILTIPYRVKSNYEVIDYVHVLPESLIVNGKIIPKSLNRGIFEIAVFDSQSTIKGKFDLRNLTDIEPDQLITDKARLSLGISDLKGIQDDVKVKWNSEVISFESGIQKIHKKTLSKGISAQVNVEELDGFIDYEIGLRLKGSGNISFIPVGKETNVALTSSWNSPSFKGNFVPEKREVNKSGFDASWMVAHLNRNFSSVLD